MAFRQLCRDDAQLPCEYTNTPYLVDSFPKWTIKAVDLSAVQEYVIMRPRHFFVVINCEIKQVSQYVYNVDHIDTVFFSHC